MISIMYRLEQSSFNGPLISVDSAFKSRKSHFALIGPLAQCQGFFIECQKMICSLIVALFFPRSPSHIHGPTVFKTLRALAAGIMAVIVSAIYGIFRIRSLAYIGKEVFENLPSIADSNSTSAISFIAKIGASRPYVSPYRPNLTFRQAMLSVRFTSSLTIVAATAFCMPIEQIRSSNYCWISAITPTIPYTASSFVSSGITQNREPEKNSIRQFYEFWASWFRGGVSHFDLLLRSVVRAVSEGSSSLAARFVLAQGAPGWN